MRYPEFLKEKGTIGFIAPSFGCSFEPYITAFDSAQRFFREKGFQMVIGPNCYADAGIGISNTPGLCGKELNEAYLSDESDVLISCGGGELMCEVVPYIDFEKIARTRPKWYMGYSDNTNFTFLSATLADTAAIYGPCAGAFGMIPPHESIEDAFELLEGRKTEIHGYRMWEKESLKSEEDPTAAYNLTEKTVFHYYPESLREKGISVRGRLLGGCLDCLSMLTGTRFDKVPQFADKYKKDGIIWFIESCDLNVMGIRRALWQMKEAGWFENVKGFLIGRPLHFGEDMMGLDQYSAVTGALQEFGVPIIMDLDIGHLPPMMPVITGAVAQVEARRDEISIRYSLE